MAFFRWFTGAPVAALVTIGLFLVMAALISAPTEDYPDPKDSPKFDFIMQKPKPWTDPVPDRPSKLPEQPPVDIQLPKKSGLPDGPGATPQSIKVDATPNPTTAQYPKPSIRVPPQYPESCRARNAQGKVVVQFDVTPDGSVTNIRILETANSCFVRTVRNAISRWKYPPAYEHGRAVMRRDVVEVFDFSLVE